MRWLPVLVLALSAAVVPGRALAQEALRPYALASNQAGTVAALVPTTKEALIAQGFQVVGSYAPVPTARVLVVTSAALKANAAKTELGGYGAVARVSVTQAGEQVQVAFTDPRWTANVFQMSSGNADVYARLQQALGGAEPFGSAKGLSASDLKGYHYMMAMPYFGDQDKLATYTTHAEAVAAVEAALAAKVSGASKVYRVDVPGTEQVLFGVAFASGKGADATVLANCDQGTLSQVAYAPYELLVVGKQVNALPGKFRIAQSFPDLTMGTFMKISSAPGAISAVLTDVADGP